MAAKNVHLGAAKEAKNDEFYTQYADIQAEMNAYLEYNPNVFRDKTILLPCDDPEWSNFTKYFAQHFEELGIKKLISTSYAQEAKHRNNKELPGHQVSIWELNSPKYDENKTDAHGKIFVLERGKTTDKNHDTHLDINDLDFDYLENDGDFRSEEVTKLRDEADIIITNPPFSLLRDFIAWIFAAPTQKQFCIIGNQNCITYKEVFPLLKNNKMWVGKRFAERVNGDHMVFRIPDTYTVSTDGYIENGEKFIEISTSGWFTNIDHGRRHETYDTMTMANQKKFSKHKEIKGHSYKKYINYDAIEVPFTDAIPKDYTGIMGVPITFMRKYCPEQFEIVGTDSPYYIDELGIKPIGQEWIDIYHEQGGTGHITANMHSLCYYDEEGTAISVYKRLLIRFTDEWIASHPEDFKNGGAKL